MSSSSRYRLARRGALAGTVWESPAGPLEILASDGGLRLIQFAANGAGVTAGTAGVPPGPARRRSPRANTYPNLQPKAEAIVAQAGQQLEEYFAGTRRDFELPLDLCGTRFQIDVWQALLRVPYGETITYRALAASAGRPAAIRAAGAANGANPLSIVVPCHRAIGTNGSLTGYAGGLPIKRFLLDLERAVRQTSRPQPPPPGVSIESTSPG